MPDYIVIQLAKFLHQGSLLYDLDADERDPPSPPAVEFEKHNLRESLDVESTTLEERVGTTAKGMLLPRERFSYWCFDLLFLICSDTSRGKSRYFVRLSFTDEL